jgi:hypothetical protein
MEMKTPIKNIRQIDTESQEGRLLFAAIGKIQRLCCPGKCIEEVIENLNHLANKIFNDDENNNLGKNTRSIIPSKHNGAGNELTE